MRSYLLPGGGHPHMKRREFIKLLGGVTGARAEVATRVTGKERHIIENYQANDLGPPATPPSRSRWMQSTAVPQPWFLRIEPSSMNDPASRPLAIPLRTSASWRPSVPGYEHARAR
jgi:hypothetical protein